MEEGREWAFWGKFIKHCSSFSKNYEENWMETERLKRKPEKNSGLAY